MKLIDLVNNSRTRVKVLDGGNGKVICHRADKNTKYKLCEVRSIWAEFYVDTLGFKHTATPVICCYLDSRDVEDVKNEVSE